jgi:hypothetical protein
VISFQTIELYLKSTRAKANESILKDSDDGVLQYGLLSFFLLCPSSGILKKTHNISKNRSVFVLRCRKKGHLLGWVRLKELTSITGQPKSGQLHI